MRPLWRDPGTYIVSPVSHLGIFIIHETRILTCWIRITVTNYEFCTVSRWPCCANVVWQLLKKNLERGFDGKGVAVLPWRETINNGEEESV